MNENSLLSYINNFIVLSDEEQKILLEAFVFRKYLKGQFIVQQGDICRYENFVNKGCLKTFFVDKEGQEHIVMFAIENWWTSDMGSFISRSPANYNVQCIEDTDVFQITHEKLEELYLKVPKMERFFRIIIQRAYIALEKRIISSFSMTAGERYILFREQYPQIEQRVPNYMIASYLGVTKEFLSKIRNQLTKK
jgi:CRP-like cAMP-binding protein